MMLSRGPAPLEEGKAQAVLKELAVINGTGDRGL